MRIAMLILLITSVAMAQTPYLSEMGNLTSDPVLGFAYKDANTIYAVYDRGVSSSFDAGETWEDCMALSATVPGIHSLFYCSNDTLLLARTNGTLQQMNESGLIVRTFIGGSSRPTVGITRSATTNHIVFARRSPSINSTWIHRSTNNAASFVTYSIVPGLFEKIAFAPDGKLYARDNTHIFRSNTEGLVWSIVATAPSTLFGELVFEADGRLVCSIESGLYTSYSGDPGTFSFIESLPANTHFTSIVAGLNNSLYGALHTGGWRYSYDRGQSWSIMNGDGNPIGSVISMSPSNYLFAGSQAGSVYRSLQQAIPVQYGRIWASLSDSLRMVSSDKVWAMLPDNAGGIFVGTWGGKVLYTSNAGASWTNITENLRVGYVWSLVRDNDYLYAATEFGVFRTLLTAIQWAPTTLGYDVRSIVNVNGNLFAAVYGHGVYRSTDQGVNWTVMNSGLTTLITTSLTVDSYHNLYVGSFGGGVQKSTDGGLSWQPSNLTYPYVWSLAVDANDIVYVGTYGSHVFRSTDLGATYEFASNGIWDPYIIQLTAIGTQVVAGTWWSGVFTTYNGGLNWNWISLLTMSEVTAIRGQNDLNPGFVRNFSTNSLNASTNSSTIVPREYKLEQNFPNPFNPSTTIRFALPEAASVRLTVFDPLGRTVTTLVEGKLTAGTHSVEFHGNNLPSGIYFYRLQAGNYQATGKMILTK